MSLVPQWLEALCQAKADESRLDIEELDTARGLMVAGLASPHAQEQEKLAAEAAAKAEQERLAAEAAAKAEQERLAAEAATQAEQERLEKERLAAEAAATAAREKAKQQDEDPTSTDAERAQAAEEAAHAARATTEKEEEETSQAEAANNVKQRVTEEEGSARQVQHPAATAQAEDHGILSSEPAASWSTKDVVAWIRTIHDGAFQKYAPAFEEHGITGEVLLELTADDLKQELGMLALGGRRRLIAAVHRLS